MQRCRDQTVDVVVVDRPAVDLFLWIVDVAVLRLVVVRRLYGEITVNFRIVEVLMSH